MTGRINNMRAWLVYGKDVDGRSILWDLYMSREDAEIRKIDLDSKGFAPITIHPRDVK